MLCNGRLPVELSSSIKALAIDCPLKSNCFRYDKGADRPHELYFNRFSKKCGSFISMDVINSEE